MKQNDELILYFIYSAMLAGVMIVVLVKIIKWMNG